MALFGGKIEPRCVYCARSFRINESDMLCNFFGVVRDGGKCVKFKYDPLKRVPPRPPRVKLPKERFSGWGEQ